MQLWEPLVSIKGVKEAKASKLLHPKYPWVFPILDSRIVKCYRPFVDVVRGRSEVHKYPQPYWNAIRQDLVDGQCWFVQLRESLGRVPSERAKLTASLTDLRLLDILTWLRGAPG